MKRCFTESFKKLDDDFLTEARQKYEAEPAGLMHFLFLLFYNSSALSQVFIPRKAGDHAL